MDDDKLIIEHRKEKRESEDFKKRKYSHWNENYFLYRDLVKTNRLTQRQAINIPIMRETIQTWISKIDEAPELKFTSRGRGDRDKTGELIVNEFWDYYFDKLKLDILDNIDKKVVGLQGRSFKICGMSKGDFFVDIIDPYDIEISPKANPLNLNDAQYVIRTHIFKPLREILANEKYQADAKMALKMYLDSKEGIIKAAESREAYIEKMGRLRDLGAENFDDYNASELLVELNESYKLQWNIKEKRFVRHLIVLAADKVVLYNKPLKEAIGIDKLPIVTWADDPDLNDIWCDGKGDSVRTVNKVVNMYMSQDIENRAYRTFGMRFYNTLNGTFSPRTFDPKPFAMYGVPGNPNEIFQEMNIPELGDATNNINFLKELIQSSVAQTPTERGLAAGSRTTLGEVEINLQQSQGRNSVSAKHYRRSWKEIGELFYELMSQNKTTPITLYKEGASGDMYKKEIYPSEWILPEGYECKVSVRADKDMADQFALQKAQYVIANFAQNPVAQKIAKRKQLEVMGWTDDEINEAMMFEDQGQDQMFSDEAAMAEEEGVEPTGQATGRPFNNSQMMQQMTA
jgi:hypothetical protein